jgi:uncharacterized membrane protein
MVLVEEMACSLSLLLPRSSAVLTRTPSASLVQLVAPSAHGTTF